MSKVCVFLADGFEECEGLLAVDLLRRAGVEVTTAGLNETTAVRSSHGIHLQADARAADLDLGGFDMLALPGGGEGTANLAASELVTGAVRRQLQAGKQVAAICAAPTVLGEAGLLKGRKATCYPGCEDGLKGAEVLTDRVVIDGNITTSRGVGTAIPFALSLTAQLFDQNKADEIRESIVYGHGPAKN